jgi:DamX protein
MRKEPSFSADSDHNVLSDVDHLSGLSRPPVDAQLLSDYRQRYGLSIDPFVDDPHFPFYTGAQRRQVLEQLLHLCQFSQNLLVVAGDYGVGKTRMAQALIDALDDADDICFVEGQITSDIDTVLTEVFAQFELAGSLELAEFCKKTSEQDGLVVLIVDNAHHLADDVIVALVNLLQENPASRLHIVMFAEPHLLERLDTINAPGLVLTDLLLEKFSLNEAVDYLNFRMEMADYLGPEVFTDNKVEPWLRQSQGQLLALHEYAQEKLLATVTSPKSFKSTKSSQLIPHIVASSVLVGGLLLGYVYFGGDGQPQKVDSAAVAPNPLELQTSAVRPAIASQSTASSVESTVLPGVEKAAVEAHQTSSESALRQVNSASSQVESVVKQSVVPLVQTNSLDNKSLQKPTQAVNVQQSSKETQKITMPNEASRVSVQEKSKAVGVELPKQGSVLSDQEKTILGWDSSEFTLQLVGLSSEKSAREFIAAQPNKKDLLLFRSVRQGKDWFVVVTGRFPTSAKARQSVQNLPLEQRQASPWSREIKVIQQEIKQHK